MRRRSGLSSGTETITETRFQPHTGQAEILQSSVRFRVVVCGRRWGKTAVGKIAALEKARNRGKVWCIMPTYSMAVDVWREHNRELNGEWVVKAGKERRLALECVRVLCVRICA